MGKNEKTLENNNNLMEELLDRINKMELEISVLKKQLADVQPYNYPPIPVINSNLCIDGIDGNDHQYPFPWHSILPPHCEKCGKQAPDYTITYDTNSGNVPWNFNKFGGNVMNNENIIY